MLNDYSFQKSLEIYQFVLSIGMYCFKTALPLRKFYITLDLERNIWNKVKEYRDLVHKFVNLIKCWHDKRKRLCASLNSYVIRLMSGKKIIWIISYFYPFYQTKLTNKHTCRSIIKLFNRMDLWGPRQLEIRIWPAQQ